MNTEKVQQEINSIITSIRAKGWRMNKPTKKALRQLDELGLIEFMGTWARADVKCDAIVNAVIDAAVDAGGKTISESGWTIEGDGYAGETKTQPSALYLALNEEEVTATEDNPIVITQQEITLVRTMPTQKVQVKTSYHRGLRQFRGDNKEGQPAPAGFTHDKNKMTKMLAKNPDIYRVCTLDAQGYSKWVLGSEWIETNS